MEHALEIKEEPIWVEEPADTSLDSYINNNVDNDAIVKVESRTLIIPKVEIEASDPRSEDPVMMPAADIKDEVTIEEQTVDQLVPCFKEESNVKDDAVLTKGPMHSCDGCCKAFSQGSSHSCHFLPSGVYRCSVCNGSFTNKGNLNSHLLSHSGQKPYTCSVCDSKFSQKSSLNRHMHIHSGDRPYCCELCNSAFTEKSNLNAHMVTHSGERPHKCSLCNMKFARKANLKRHMQHHSRGRPYSCSICKSTFALTRFLNVHMLAHSREDGLC